jgi:hypothetical protein
MLSSEIEVSWDSISLDNITMTSDPCSYTINQKSNRVECSGACVAINFGQDSAKVGKYVIILLLSSSIPK